MSWLRGLGGFQAVSLREREKEHRASRGATEVLAAHAGAGSTLGINRGSAAVEEILEEGGGGDGVELLFLALPRQLFAGALAADQLLLGVEAAEALVDEQHRFARPRRQRPAPRDGRPRGGAGAAVHVQRQADDQALGPLLLHHL